MVAQRVGTRIAIHDGPRIDEVAEDSQSPQPILPRVAVQDAVASPCPSHASEVTGTELVPRGTALPAAAGVDAAPAATSELEAMLDALTARQAEKSAQKKAAAAATKAAENAAKKAAAATSKADEKHEARQGETAAGPTIPKVAAQKRPASRKETAPIGPPANKAPVMKRPAASSGDEPVVIKGCSKCRWSRRGCTQCKDKNYTGFKWNVSADS